MNAANKVPGPPARRPGSPAPSWRSWRPYYGASTTAAPVSASPPSYEAIAERADCARSVVAEARKALEWAGVLTWQNRITRVWERCRDLFGRDGWRWRLEVRTSNAYIFRDPKAPNPSQSENRSGTLNQDISSLSPAASQPARKEKEALSKELTGRSRPHPPAERLQNSLRYSS